MDIPRYINCVYLRMLVYIHVCSYIYSCIPVYSTVYLPLTIVLCPNLFPTHILFVHGIQGKMNLVRLRDHFQRENLLFNSLGTAALPFAPCQLTQSRMNHQISKFNKSNHKFSRHWQFSQPALHGNLGP